MSHFAGKEALGHIQEKKMEGRVETHGLETAGHMGAALDALRETSLALLLFWAILQFFYEPQLKILILFGSAFALWKGGRAATLAWSRLERLHRIVKQEKHEIENNRSQEKEELIALYQEKGFSGKLLHEVVDFLMADEDRLLKVMLEEELGLTLEAYEHPLKQATFAFLGALFSLTALTLSFLLFPLWGILLSAVLVIAIGTAISAILDKNRLITAVIWNLAFTALSMGLIYFFK